MDLLIYLICAITGYLSGSINTAVIVGRGYGVDIRSLGSGNAGANNAVRTLGKKAGLLVTAGDLLKGAFACIAGLIAGTLIVNGGLNALGVPYEADNYGRMIAGLFAIAGHNWPVYFSFKGGKGILVSLVVIFFMDWKIALILLGIFLVIVLITRYVSLGSIAGASLLPIMSFVFNKGIIFFIIGMIIAVLAVVRHKSNIKRLLDGTESRFGSKKKKGET